uniref:Uncharacterized protein n=1 Tax=Oryza sativa subsp. japonica TaxID=39947 RepID=Q2R2F4_ORYSJ|nr:hypothetical protein LOC_Os11g35990 [Oryza sativa Japonica Group]
MACFCPLCPFPLPAKPRLCFAPCATTASIPNRHGHRHRTDFQPIVFMDL